MNQMLELTKKGFEAAIIKKKKKKLQQSITNLLATIKMQESQQRNGSYNKRIKWKLQHWRCGGGSLTRWVQWQMEMPRPISELEDTARVFTQSEQKSNITSRTCGTTTKDPTFMSSESQKERRKRMGLSF